MSKKFQRWTGLQRITDEEIQEERDTIMRSEYLHPIENFPEKIDQFLDAINRLYMSQRMERERLKEITI
ncbi:unnamed protein product [Adineta steineri]|nr:unnamed protein product [Adineta steineri]